VEGARRDVAERRRAVQAVAPKEGVILGAALAFVLMAATLSLSLLSNALVQRRCRR
jgi:hypothetical protein